jgi:ribonuclease BN (tRNA processing enzyme)
LVFDLGTGARLLGQKLVEEAVDRIYVVLSHTHIDHIYALPYFDPVFSPNARVHIGVPADSAGEARARIGKYLNGLLHPLRLDDLGARLKFYGVPAGQTLEVGPYTVETLRLLHPGGTMGYRASLGSGSICYLTDTGPLARPDEGIIAGMEPTSMEQDLIHLVRDADVLVMDATFDQDEYFEKMNWGHSYPEYIVAIAERANVKRVALFHHNPDATDDDLDVVSARWKDHTAPEVVVAKEGMVMDLEG